MSNDNQFITTETLAKILAVFACSISNDVSGYESKLEKACESLEIICVPYAEAFSLNTGKQVIPWSCEDIASAYPNHKNQIILNRDIIACQEILLAMPSNWISCNGKDFSEKSHYQALALLVFGIGHLTVRQITNIQSHHVA